MKRVHQRSVPSPQRLSAGLALMNLIPRIEQGGSFATAENMGEGTPATVRGMGASARRRLVLRRAACPEVRPEILLRWRDAAF